jgi:hypothetical protein
MSHISDDLKRYLQKHDPVTLQIIKDAISDIELTPKIPFEQWWQLYAKKIDRTKCERAWNKLSLSDQETAIQHTAIYVESTPEIKYRRNPSTYLNNKNWNDDDIIKGHTNHNQKAERNKSVWGELGFNV